MHISRKSLWGTISIALVMLVVLAVVLSVSRQVAVQSAVRGCNPGYGLQPIEPPTEFHTKLTILGLTDPSAQGPSTRSLSVNWRPVWVVDMTGKWQLVGGPPPDPANPGPFYWNECIQIIDALTGEDRSFPIE